MARNAKTVFGIQAYYPIPSLTLTRTALPKEDKNPTLGICVGRVWKSRAAECWLAMFSAALPTLGTWLRTAPPPRPPALGFGFVRPVRSF